MPSEPLMLDFNISNQQFDNQAVCVHDILSFFESELSRMTARSAALYRRSVESLRKACRPARPFDAEAVEHWLATMAIDGIKLSTAIYYLENIRALTNKARAAGIDVAPVTAHRIERSAVTHLADLPDINFAALDKVVSEYKKLASPLRIAVDVFLFSLACGGLDIESIVAVETEELDQLPRAARDIAQTYAVGRRRFVFPLGQGRRTNRRIAADICRRLQAVSQYFGLKCSAFENGDMQRLWLAIALAGGVAPSFIMAARQSTAPVNSALMLVKPSQHTTEDIKSMYSMLVDTLTRHPQRWHVMRMNRGVEPARVLDLIEEAGLEQPATYYPVETIVRRREHRIEQHTRPVLPGILFFKASTAEVAPIMAAVCDCAGIYRLTSSSSSPYATISDASMYAFQAALAQFTPDMQTGADTFDIAPGSEVDIIAGTMQGYRGMVHATLPSVDGIRVFELKIHSDFGFEWTAQIPEIHLRPL